MTMSNVYNLICIANGEVGTKENPAGSNRVKYGEWYGLNGEPWCAMFVSWCFSKIKALDLIGGKFAYCPDGVAYAKNNGLWLDRAEKPQPGDVVFFANEKGVACHVGIVLSRNGSESVTTIEGNTSQSSNDNGGAVMKRVRTYGAKGSSWYILGFMRPKWPNAYDSNIEQFAVNVIYGVYGDGEARKTALGSAYESVQKRVNQYVNVANEVCDGKWGNGWNRKTSLEGAGYNYEAVQRLVNDSLR